MINNSCQGGSLVAAILTGDAQLLGAALDSDIIIEPVRAPLIPGMPAVKEAAKAAGEAGSSSSWTRLSRWQHYFSQPAAAKEKLNSTIMQSGHQLQWRSPAVADVRL